MREDLSDFESDVAAAIAAAAPAAQEVELLADRTAVVASPAGTVLTYVDRESIGAQPRRSRGTVRASTFDGFLAAVNDRQNDSTVVYVDLDECAAVAVINDDREVAGAGWRDHRVELALKATPEWVLWTGNQGLGEQRKFAEIIEEGEDEIRHPSAIEMLELAQTFHSSTTAKFKQGGRLKDGRTQLTYEEDVTANAGEGGSLAIPDEFVLGLRPYYGADRIEVRARLRYTARGGQLQIGYFLRRHEDLRRAAFADDVQTKIAPNIGGAPLVEGRPAVPTT